MPCKVLLLTSDSEMVSTHGHIHMNLTGHTLQGFWNV
jgi:hypothetical protein